MEVFTKIVFPLFGMLMIAGAIGAFVFPYGNKFKDSVQTIKAFGIELQISVVTAIILGGMIFCGVGFYLNEYSYKKKFEVANDKQDELGRKVSDLKNEINDMKVQSITYQLTMDDLSDEEPPPSAKELHCIFYKNYRLKDDSTVYNVYPVKSRGYKVTFENLSAQMLRDNVPVVYLVNKKTGRRWVATSFDPLSPTLSLSPEQ